MLKRDDPIALLQVKALEEAARSLGVTLQVHDIRTADDLPAAFDAAAIVDFGGLMAYDVSYPDVCTENQILQYW